MAGAAAIARVDQGGAERTAAPRRAPARCRARCAASASSPARTEPWRVAPPDTGAQQIEALRSRLRKGAVVADGSPAGRCATSGWLGKASGGSRRIIGMPPIVRYCLGTAAGPHSASGGDHDGGNAVGMQSLLHGMRRYALARMIAAKPALALRNYFCSAALVATLNWLNSRQCDMSPKSCAAVHDHPAVAIRLRRRPGRLRQSRGSGPDVRHHRRAVPPACRMAWRRPGRLGDDGERRRWSTAGARRACAAKGRASASRRSAGRLRGALDGGGRAHRGRLPAPTSSTSTWAVRRST